MRLLRYEINKSSIKRFHQRPSEFQRCHEVLKKYLDTCKTCGLYRGNYRGLITQRLEKHLKNKWNFPEKSKCLIMRGCFFFEVNTNPALKKINKVLNQYDSSLFFLLTVLLFFHCVSLKYVS